MNATRIKTFAVIAMIIDHVAWAFLPLSSPLAQVMHSIGRFTFPIMAFFIVEGFFHTSDFRAYLKRMGLFSIIAHFPYQYFTFGRIPLFQQQVGDGLYEVFASSVLFTFFISLIVLWIVHSWKKPEWIRGFALFIVSSLTLYSDYSLFGPLLVLAYSFQRDDRTKQIRNASLFMIPYILMNLYQPYTESIFVIATILPNLLLLYYNNQQGSSKKLWVKYLFYIIYPTHLLLLGLIQ